MALKTCPDCERQVSDKAETCPQCGRRLRMHPVTLIVVTLAWTWATIVILWLWIAFVIVGSVWPPFQRP